MLRIHKLTTNSSVNLTFSSSHAVLNTNKQIVCKQTHQLDLTGKINNSLQFATQSAMLQSRLIKIFYDVRLRIAISSNTFHWLFHSNCHRKLRHWLSPADLLERWSIKYYLTDLVRERKEEGNNPQFFFLDRKSGSGKEKHFRIRCWSSFCPFWSIICFLGLWITLFNKKRHFSPFWSRLSGLCSQREGGGVSPYLKTVPVK